MELGRYSNVGAGQLPPGQMLDPTAARRLGLADRSLDRANGGAFFNSRQELLANEYKKVL